MKISTVIMALVVTAGTAMAQQPPQPPFETAPEDPVDPVPPPPPPQPQPPPPPPPQPQPQPQPVRTADPMEPVEHHRPSAFSIGVGIGYSFPTSLETPNISSVRFRLPTGMTFEPQVRFVNASQEIDTGTSTENSVSNIEVGALVRFPLMKRGRVDLELLGALAVETQNEEPDAPDSDTTTTGFSAAYGLAVTSWISSHWQLSLSAINPIVSTVKVDQELGPGTSTVTTSTSYGLVWDPSVFLMVHLYH